MRELHLSAGTIAIGHRQRYAHLNVFLKGKVELLDIDDTVRFLEAPLTFVAPAGRKIGYVLEDVIWQNIYATNETDIDVLEAMFLDKSDAFNEHAAQIFAQQAVLHEHDRQDYHSAIAQLGYTEEQVQVQVNNKADQVLILPGRWCVHISPIHGDGIFCTSPIKAGEVIGIARLGPNRTQLGRFTNHSRIPNAVFKFDGINILLIALSDLIGQAGGQPGQEITVDYRQAVNLLRSSQ